MYTRNKIFILFSFIIICLNGNRLDEITTVDGYLNMCTLADHLKPSPSPEKDLQFCSKWTANSCCPATIDAQIEDQSLLGFNFNTCGSMNETCLGYFKTDHCFVKCSPNLGPWIVQMDERSKFNERPFKIPLCESDCNAWFAACQTSKSCASNWQSGGFDWSSGENECRPQFECRTIGDIYGNAKDFCERIWDHAYTVVSDKTDDIWGTNPPHCMKFTNPEHNKKIAAAEAKFILHRVFGGSQGFPPGSFLLSNSFIFLTYITMV